MFSFPFSLRKAVVVIFSALIAMVLYVLIINWSVFDEELSPEISQLLVSNIMPAAEQNAYFAILGITAADDKDIQTAGIQLIDKYLVNRDQEGRDELSDEDYKAIIGEPASQDKWDSDFAGCQSRRELACLAKLTLQLEQQPITSERTQLLLKRYDHVMQMRHYKDLQTISHNVPFPAFGDLIKLGQMKIAQAYLSKQNTLFLNEVQLNVRFWRMVLRDSDMLLSKMVAVAMLWNDFQYISEFIAARSLTIQEVTTIEQILTPLTRAELDIGEAFAFEQRFFTAYLQAENFSLFAEHSAPTKMLIPLFLQTNATLNSNYRYFTKPMINLSALTSKDLAISINQQRGQSNNECCAFTSEQSALLSVSPSSLYNLSGKLLISENVFHGEDYIARTHDLNGMLNLINLQLSLKPIEDSLIMQTIDNSVYSDPYSEKPINWNKADNRLAFTCLDKSSLCSVNL